MYLPESRFQTTCPIRNIERKKELAVEVTDCGSSIPTADGDRIEREVQCGFPAQGGMLGSSSTGT